VKECGEVEEGTVNCDRVWNMERGEEEWRGVQWSVERGMQ
jgi:hypothetical protein